MIPRATLLSTTFLFLLLVAGAPAQNLPCAPVPPGTSFWATLDEAAGQPLANIAAPTLPGYDVGGPAVVFGRVIPGLARHYDGLSQYSEFPNHPWLNPIEGNFGETMSIDCWINVLPGGDLSGRRVIVEKRAAVGAGPIKGFSLYLDSGYLGFQIADGTTTDYTAFVPSHQIHADGQWRFVAVTMHRTLGAGTLYVDMVPWSFDPSSHQNEMNNPAPLRIGAATSGPPNHFSGIIDEVELSQDWLQAPALNAVFSSGVGGANGKCKSDVTILVPPSFTASQTCGIIPARIRNHNATPRTYTWAFSSVPANGAPGCTIAGPTQIIPTGPPSVTIPAHSHADVSVLVNRPLGVGYACMSISVSDGNFAMTDTKGFWVDFIGLSTAPSCTYIPKVQLGAGVNQIDTAVFTLGNETATPLPVSYTIVVLGPDDAPEFEKVSLNGLPPGAVVVSADTIAPGAILEIPISARFVRRDPMRDYSIVLYEDSTGLAIPVASINLRDEAPSELFAEMLTPGAGKLELRLQGEAATPGSFLLTFLTVSPGAFPFGWLGGLDLPLGDLAAQYDAAASGAAPFLQIVGPDGASTWVYDGPGIVPGIPLQGVSMALSPSGVPTVFSNPFSCITR